MSQVWGNGLGSCWEEVVRSRVAGPVVPGDAGFAHLTPLSRSRAWRDGQTQSSTQKGPVFLTVWCGSPAVCTGAKQPRSG